MKEAWRYYGPDFRLGNTLISEHRTLESYHQVVKDVIDQLDLDALQKYVGNPYSGLDISHYCIETYSLASQPDVLVHRLHSRTIWRMFMAAIAVHDLEQRWQLYSVFHSTRRLSVSRGYLFEVMANDILSQGLNVTLVPQNGGSPEQFTFSQRTMQLFSNTSKANTTTGEHFYVPLQGNNPTYNAFCYQSRIGVAIQSTICFKHHFSSKGFRDLNARFKAASVEKRYFIFVVPFDNGFHYPKLPAKREPWRFFTLELDVSQVGTLRECSPAAS